MKITRWIPFLELYDLTFSPDPAAVRLTPRAASAELLKQAGIYLIVDPSIPDESLIYIGQAGGRGGGSHFDARIRKHALKAMGVTTRTVPGNGITDTRRWSDYRDAYLRRTGASDFSRILSNWQVRMLALPNGTDDQRRVIDLMEQVAALAFDRGCHAGPAAPVLPQCNTQQLAAQLLDWLADRPQGAGEAQPTAVVQADDALPAQIDAATAGQREWEVDLEDQIVPVDDDAWRDEAFVETFRAPEVQEPLYAALLVEIRAVCEEPNGWAVGLTVAYTNAANRDLRVRGNFGGFKVLMRLVARGDGFKVYVLMTPDDPEILSLHPYAEPNDRLTASFQCGGPRADQPGCTAAEVGRVLRLALAAAPREQGARVPRGRRRATLPARDAVPAADRTGQVDPTSPTDRAPEPLAARDVLRADPEPMPDWLARFRPGDRIAWSDFSASRVVYYPGAGTDGQPVAVFGGAGAAHCFLFVDYGLERRAVERELDHPAHGFMGYRSLARVSMAEEELTPRGWISHVKPEEVPHRANHFATARPYAFIEVLERLPSHGPEHGPERLAILFLAADGVAAYDALFCQPGGRAPFAVVLQDHGFGGNYTTFGEGGLLGAVARRADRYPELLFVAKGNTRPWSGYQEIPGAVAHGGGMHHFDRSLYRRA